MTIPCVRIAHPNFTISEKDLLVLIDKNKEIGVVLERIKAEGMMKFEEARKRFREVNNIE